MIKTKVCSKCKKRKFLSKFAKQKAGKYGVTRICKECCKKYQKKQRKRNPVPDMKYNLGKKFGITPNDYFKLFKKQKGKCAICGKHQINFNRRLAVDHNHKTNEIRGLLCVNCNSKLGWFEKRKNKILDYLKER